MKQNPSIIYKMTHLPTGKIYIGSLKDSSKFKTYLTSSITVKRMMTENPSEWLKEIVKSFHDTEFMHVVAEEQNMIKETVITLGWDKVWNRFYHSGVAKCYSPEAQAKRAYAQMLPAVRKKKSESMKVTMGSAEMKAHLSKMAKLQMSVPGARKAITEGQMGEKNHFFGKKHSEETKAKMRAAINLRPKLSCELCGYEGTASSLALHKKHKH